MWAKPQINIDSTGGDQTPVPTSHIAAPDHVLILDPVYTVISLLVVGHWQTWLKPHKGGVQT